MRGVVRCRLMNVLLCTALLIILVCVINRLKQEFVAELVPVSVPVNALSEESRVPIPVEDLLEDRSVPQFQVRGLAVNHGDRSPYIQSVESAVDSNPILPSTSDNAHLINSHEQSPVSAQADPTTSDPTVISTIVKPLKVAMIAKPSSTTSPVRNSSASTSTPVVCKEELCLENLNSQYGDREMFETCHSKTILYVQEVLHINKPSINKCSCHFQKSVHNRLVALVSLPGSGNTWVRGLLEKATGICTGSKFCDKALRSGGFCGEGMISGSTVVVKTHEFFLNWQSPSETNRAISIRDGRAFYTSAIFIFRSPYNAAVSEWNRKQGRSAPANRHVSVITDAKYFGSNAKWQEFASKHLTKWSRMINTYILKGGQRVLAVCYEDLKRDEAGEVRRMVEFLGVPYSGETSGEGFTTFYRNHTDTFDHFTPEQKILFNSQIKELSDLLQGSGMLQYANKVLAYIRPT